MSDSYRERRRRHAKGGGPTAHQQRRPDPPRVTLADAVMTSGQRLRQGEAANWCTFLVSLRAQWQAQHAGGAR